MALAEIPFAQSQRAIPSRASENQNNLTNCLARSTTQQDKKDMARWIFATVTLHPDLSDLVSITSEQHDALDKKMASIFQRLITEDCRIEVRNVFLDGKPDEFKSSFKILGEIAVTSLLKDHNVEAGSISYLKYIDFNKIVGEVFVKSIQNP
jgi:hypothetical protein